MEHECIQADKIDKMVENIDNLSNLVTNMRIDQAKSITEITNIMLGVVDLKSKMECQLDSSRVSNGRVSLLEGRSGLVDKIITVLLSAAVFFGFNLLLKFIP